MKELSKRFIYGDNVYEQVERQGEVALYRVTKTRDVYPDPREKRKEPSTPTYDVVVVQVQKEPPPERELYQWQDGFYGLELKEAREKFGELTRKATENTEDTEKKKKA